MENIFDGKVTFVGRINLYVALLADWPTWRNGALRSGQIGNLAQDHGPTLS